MTQKAIRLSPSGPVIQNDNGAPLVPGPGFRLRLVEGTCTVSAATVIPTVPTSISTLSLANNLNQSLPLPNPDARYRATIVCDVANPTTNVAGEVQLYLDVSTDNATWTNAAANTHFVSENTTIGEARHCRLDLVLNDGANLGVTATPQSPALYVRARIGATSGGGVIQLQSYVTPGGTINTGSIHLELEECF